MENEQYMFYFAIKHKNFAWAVLPQDTRRFLFVRNLYQQRATEPTTDRQTLRRFDLRRALGGDGWCVKKLFDWYNPMFTFSVCWTARAALIVKFLSVFHENSVHLHNFSYALFTGPVVTQLRLFVQLAVNSCCTDCDEIRPKDQSLKCHRRTDGRT
jgi:hypothetical protein